MTSNIHIRDWVLRRRDQSNGNGNESDSNSNVGNNGEDSGNNDSSRSSSGADPASPHSHHAMLECEQRGGDVVFVPAYWAHAVLNARDSVAVALEFSQCADLARDS